MVSKGDSFETVVQSEPDDLGAGESMALTEGVYQIEVPSGLVAHVTMQKAYDDDSCQSRIPE